MDIQQGIRDVAVPDIRGGIGVMDSGIGGISVLRALTALMPAERFAYFGDSANTPYGEKPDEWVLERTQAIVHAFVDAGAKAVVIACNTATSIAAETLRAQMPDVPIVGVEPALKPAALALPGKRVLVMATPMTLRLEKYQRLADTWATGCEVVPVACTGLAARIERGNLDAPDVDEMLERLIGEWRGRVDGIVLGCTHYPFVSDAIRRVMGDVPQFDGAQGTARQLQRVLQERGRLAAAPSDEPQDARPETPQAAAPEPSVAFATSSDDPAELSLYRNLFA